MAVVMVYTDGACSGNQKKENLGGYAAVVVFQDKVLKNITGAEQNTTNNRMELTAIIEGLKSLKTKRIPVVVRSDSAYCVNCINQGWFKKWKANGWRNAKNKPVENKDLWTALFDIASTFSYIKFEKVAGHSGDTYNDVADKLAKDCIIKLREEISNGNV